MVFMKCDRVSVLFYQKNVVLEKETLGDLKKKAKEIHPIWSGEMQVYLF